MKVRMQRNSLQQQKLAGCLGTAILASSLTHTAPLLAQETDPFDSLINRARPEFSQPPIRTGGFDLIPDIEFDLEAIDNVFASDTLDVNDVTLSLRPRLLIRDRRSDRELVVNTRASVRKYLDNTVSDRVEVNVNGRGRFGLGTRTRPFVGFQFRQNDASSVEFSDLSVAAQPIDLTAFGGNAGIEQDFGPVTAVGEARYTRTDFRGGLVENATTNNGLDDFDLLLGRLRLGYSVNPAQRIYVEGQINDRRYSTDASAVGIAPDSIIDRSSSGFSVRAGFARQITDILLVDINAGFLRQEFDDPTLSDVDAVSFDGRILYSPTRLTRFRLSAARTIDDTVNPFFSGLLRTEFSGAVEHELRRDLVVTGEGRYTVIDERGSAVQDTGDIEEFQLSASVNYFISPRWNARVRASVFNRSSIFGGTQIRSLVGLAYSF